MCPRIRPRVAAAILFAAAGLSGALPGAATAQQRDGRIPDPGDLWLEISPTLLNWTDQFALGSRDSSIADGGREPLFADFDGPIASRLYPGPQSFISDLNADADALGFTPFDENGFSVGSLDYSDVTAQIRRLAMGFEFGVFRRLAVGLRAPFTLSRVETSFAYDTASATVTHARNVLVTSDPFFNDAATSLSTLDQLIASGSLMGDELANAMELRTRTDAFLTALQGRVDDNAFVPTGMSPAGLEMLARFAELTGGFEALGLALPELMLPDFATSSDLGLLFTGDSIRAPVPGPTRTGLALGEFEVSARFNLLDRITPRYAPETEGPREPAAEPAVPPDSASAASAGQEPAGPQRLRRGTVRLRTTIGALVRIPAGSNGVIPFADPTSYHHVPIGDGQMDIELALYQDVALADWFLLRAVGRYGIQLPDNLVVRIHSPDRPFALASTEAAVHRDLGDYLQVTLRPAVRLNSAMWFGIDYDYWKLGNASFTVIDALTEGADASPLELETGQTRHMLGFGITYDVTNAEGRDDVVAHRRPIRAPWQFSLSMRKSIAGSGGRTPAPFFYQATMRFPITIF